MLSDSALSEGQVCSLSTALFNNAALDVHRRRDLDIECILNPEYDQANMNPPLLRCRFLGLSLPGLTFRVLLGYTAECAAGPERDTLVACVALRGSSRQLIAEVGREGTHNGGTTFDEAPGYADCSNVGLRPRSTISGTSIFFISSRPSLSWTTPACVRMSLHEYTVATVWMNNVALNDLSGRVLLRPIST